MIYRLCTSSKNDVLETGGQSLIILMGAGVKKGVDIARREACLMETAEAVGRSVEADLLSRVIAAATVQVEVVVRARASTIVKARELYVTWTMNSASLLLHVLKLLLHTSRSLLFTRPCRFVPQ